MTRHFEFDGHVVCGARLPAGQPVTDTLYDTTCARCRRTRQFRDLTDRAAYAHLAENADYYTALLDALRHLCAALDLSDPDHPHFRDSCADVVEFLWLKEPDVRALLARLEGRP